MLGEDEVFVILRCSPRWKISASFKWNFFLCYFFTPFSLCILSKFPSCIVVAPCLCNSKFPSNNLTTCLHKCLKLLSLQKISHIMNLDNFVISMIKSRRFHLFINNVLCLVHVLSLNMHWLSILEKKSYMLTDHKSQHHKLFGVCLHGSSYFHKNVRNIDSAIIWSDFNLVLYRFDNGFY